VFQQIVAEGGMLAQDEALENPGFFDAESEQLFAWFGEEYQRRAQDRRGTGRRRPKGEESDAFAPVELPENFPAAAGPTAVTAPKRRARRGNGATV
jgi:hypothetical protein